MSFWKSTFCLIFTWDKGTLNTLVLSKYAMMKELLKRKKYKNNVCHFLMLFNIDKNFSKIQLFLKFGLTLSLPTYLLTLKFFLKVFMSFYFEILEFYVLRLFWVVHIKTHLQRFTIKTILNFFKLKNKISLFCID